MALLIWDELAEIALYNNIYRGCYLYFPQVVYGYSSDACFYVYDCEQGTILE